jgi:predicted nucleotidyltransferase
MAILDLTRSRTRAALLRLLFADPDAEWHLRGLARELGVSAGNVRREVLRLTADDLLTMRRQANLTLYRLNKDHPLYGELRSMVSKTIGVEWALGEALAGVAGVRLAFIYGSVAAGRETAASDIDLMVVGSASVRELHAALRPLEDTLRRSINFMVFDEDEFAQRVRDRDGFVLDVLAGRRTMVIGTDEQLRALA